MNWISLFLNCGSTAEAKKKKRKRVSGLLCGWALDTYSDRGEEGRGYARVTSCQTALHGQGLSNIIFLLLFVATRWELIGVRTTPIPNANDNSRLKYEFLKKKHAILIAHDNKLTKQIQILSSSQGKRATIAGVVVLIIYQPPLKRKTKDGP